MSVPKTLDEYIVWAAENIGSDFADSKSKRFYEVNLSNFFNSISEHAFFRGLNIELEKAETEYRSATNSELLMEKSTPRLLQKPYSSAVDKSFRVNVLWNTSFPEQPKRGWVTTDNLPFYFNDTIRCCIVCKFIDGPRFVTDRLMTYAKSLGLDRRRYSQERDDGYYAHHYYVRFPVKTVDKNWRENETDIEVEVQVTTQLQDVLRSLTHTFYQANRLTPDEDSSKWKWDFASNRFRVGYLSHTLHLLESIILQSRNEVASGKTKVD